jgi:dipeptidyl aminopeptidase/acylaminoacyl peptidase
MTTVLTGKVTPEDILSEKAISDAQISPDGDLVAFVLAESFEEGTPKAKSNIWLAERTTGRVRQFTNGPRTDYMPRWSPDGTKLALLSDRLQSGKFQAYIIPRVGGEALQLTDFHGAVSRSDLAPSGMSTGEIISIVWSHSGQSIAFLMYDPETPEDIARRDETGDALEFEEHPKYGRIWVVDVTTKALRCVTSDYHIWEFDWSPDGKQFVALIADEPYEWTWHIARIAVIPLVTGKPREIFTKRTKQFGGLLWSQDGKTVYYLSATLSDRPLVGGDAFAIDASGKSPPVNLSEDRLGSVHWMRRYSSDKLVLYSINMTKSIFSLMQASGPNTGKFEILSETETALAERGWPKFSISQDGRQQGRCCLRQAIPA